MMTIKGKVLTILLALAFNAFAAEWTGANSEPATTKTIDGKKFYVISSANELAWFAVQVNSGNANINGFLKHDVNLGPDEENYSNYPWTPIGKDSTKLFGGVFDGNGKKIGGLKISSGKFNGLFGVTDGNAQIKNLTIGVNSVVSDSSALARVYAGMFVAVNNGTIMNVTNLGNVKIQTYLKQESYSFSTYNYVAGITGKNNGIVQNAVNDGFVFNYQYAENTKYERGATADPKGYVGGIAGYNTGSIDKSINLDSLYDRTTYRTSYSSSDFKSYASVYAGGITGYNTGYVQNCINYGNMYALGSETYAGGIVGRTNLNTINSFSVSGRIASPGPATNCYYNLTSSSQITAIEGVIGIQSEDMQVDEFAWILNSTNGNTENSGVWSRYDGYPVYANDTLLAIHKIVFDDDGNTTILYTNYRGLISKFPDVLQAPEGRAFAGWVNSNGEFVDSTTVFTEDQTVTAVFKDWEDVVYSIRFLDEKGNVLDLKSVHSGEIPVYGGAEPTKKSTVAYTYTFKGWSPEIAPAVWHTDYTVMFDSIINQYKVSYVDYDGTELFSSMFDYGTKPTYSTIPKKTNTVAYLYSFVGWSPAVENVSGEAVYKAIYDSVLQKYSIEFKANGETLLSKDYDYGSVPKYENATPTKPATKAYSYSFAGWEPEIANVTEATSYTAKFDSSLNKYMVVFQNGAKVLQDSEIEYGKVPVYEGETPKKTSTAKYDYSFSSWSPALTKVTDEATYTALFDSTLRSYEVSFVSEGETLLAKEYEYGTFPKFEGNEPSKKESKGFTYSFKGWNPSVAMVKDKAVYTAVFDSVAKTFVVTFMNGKDTLQSTAVAYGNTPEYKGKTPTKSGSDKYEFKFSGWSPKLATVTEEAVYKAVFDSTKLTGILVSRLVNSNLLIKVNSRNIQISAAPVGKAYALLDMQGRVLQKGRVDSANFSIVAPRSGSFFIRIGSLIRIVRIK